MAEQSRRELHGLTALCALALTFCALPALVGASAQAATGHPFLQSLTEAPPGTPLKEPSAMAVDQATGHVFVADTIAGTIDIYNSAGAFLSQIGEGSLFASGIAVDEASGLLYVVDSFQNAIAVYKPNGSGAYTRLSEWSGQATPSEEFGEVSGVGVDNSGSVSAGDVYVVEAEDPESGFGAVQVFKPKPPGLEEASEGDFVRSLSAGKMEEPNGVAVDGSSGKVFIADSAKGAVYQFSAAGAAEGKLNGKGQPNGTFLGSEEETGNVSAVALDPTTGDLLVAEAQRHLLAEFNPAGEWVGWITSTPAGALGETYGLALAATGNVYAADATQRRVDVFGAGVVVPDAITGKVAKAGLTRTSALLPGTINGDGKASKYRFQYGETEALGSETSTQSSGAGEEKVSATIEGLHAGRTYFFRIVGENENGANYGLIREFTTPTAVEGLSTGPVANLQPTSATLTGSLSPNGFDAHYYFQWGKSAAYGSQSPAPPGTDAGEGAEAVKAETGLSGLVPNTTYHYRIVAENSFGTSFGSDQAFTTSGPPRITSEPATAIGHEEATLNAKVNPDELESTYHFEYGETTAYGTEVPLGGQSIGSGAVPVAVSATLSKLKLGVTYHFRVIAENSAGTSTGPDQKFTTIAPAPVDATYATGVSATGATLHTLINPLGNETTYYFQYGTESCKANPASCTSIPTPPGEDIGAGSEDVAESVALSGLSPSTTYFYRVIAINSLGTSEGPERSFTTDEPVSSFALPDGRAFEMVSPPNKQGAPVEALTREGGIILASEDGSKLTYVVDGALGENVEGNRSPEWQQVLATRGSSEWESQDIATPSSKAKGIAGGNAPEYQFFTPDLSTALDEPAEPGPQPPLAPGVTQATPYLRDNSTTTYLPLVTEANTSPGTQFGGHLHFLSATPDLSHVVIASTVALTGPGSSHGLYEWSGGQLQFVSVLPDGTASTGEAELGFFGRAVSHAISDDGSRVFWSSKQENSGKGRLYMRDTARGQTIRLDAAKGVAEPEASSAQFQTASSDGSRVFFTDKQRLTPESTAEPGQAQTAGKPDLYECDIIEVTSKLSCDLKDLTVDHNEGGNATVQNLLLGVGGDGAAVYLVAQGVLAGNENGNGETAQVGKNNLYRLQYDGSQWTTTFIATLSGDDSPEWEANNNVNTSFLTARVSPNGRYLAFMSAAPITGYDNVDVSSSAKGARDEEVYLYDSATASLRCVSCNPSGARPAGVLDTSESGEGLGLLVDRRKVWAELGKEHWLAGNIPGWTAQTLASALLQSRYLSDDGRLYFNSPDRLVPAARNAKENVYQYEPSGVGSCESPTGGCVALLSGGSSDHESAFIEATPDASSVFFVTQAQLLPQDTDTAFDIYDARECTASSPCLTPPPPPPGGCTSAGTCRPASPPLQAPGGPSGSATFSGPGNAAPLPASKQQGLKSRVKPLTRAQKLAHALKACKKQHRKKKRKACQAHARKLYGPKVKAEGTTTGKKTSSTSSSGRAAAR
jgi:sugar lactone lactonase YvrE